MENKKISKWTWILGIVIVLILGVAGFSVSKYNMIIEKEETVTTMEANIQTALQARLDKINEMMPSVQGILDHESEVYKNIAALRSNMKGVQLDENGNLSIDSKASSQQLEEADASSSQMIRDIHVAIEAYPQLQASSVMQDFMTSIEGIENRLSVARDNYNEAIQDYNTTIRKFPNNVISKMFGFTTKEKYEASKIAQEAPSVNFD